MFGLDENLTSTSEQCEMHQVY